MTGSVSIGVDDSSETCQVLHDPVASELNRDSLNSQEALLFQAHMTQGTYFVAFIRNLGTNSMGLIRSKARKNSLSCRAARKRYLKQLFKKCHQGNYEDVEHILNIRNDANANDRYGETLLTVACARDRFDIVELLLSHSANMNKPNENGFTPLMIASENGHFKLVKLLVEQGAKVNMTNIEHKSALMLASQNGHANIVEFLIAERADINMQDKDGASALMLATVGQHKDIVRMLLDRGADTHAQNSQGATALQIIERMQNEQIDLKKMLLEARTSHSSVQVTITADQIAARVGIDSRLLDQPFSEDLLTPIARLIPNWLEYAQALKLTDQEINGIKTDPHLEYSMRARVLLKIWHRKNAHHIKLDQNRALVQVSCDLGQADVAANICRAINENSQLPLPKDEDSATYIKEDLKLFRNKQIGNGKFASVFRGELKSKSCALKVLTNDNLLHLLATATANRDTMEVFENECERIAGFKHENIVQQLATERHPRTGELIVVLELMDCNLSQYFLSTPREEVTFTVQKRLCTNIISALEYIHECKIVHQNLCGENILLDCTKEIPTAKLGGFCISTITSMKGTEISLPAFGHRGYLPPEAFITDSSQFDTSFDVFQFGVLMLQIVQCLPTIRSALDRSTECNKIDFDHPLRPLIKDCLLEHASFRPVSAQLHSQLKVLEFHA